MDKEINESLEEELEEENLEKEKTKSKTKTKKDIVKELELKLKETEDKYYESLAKMRDLHKSYQKENAISIKYVNEDLMLELLPLYDIFAQVLENKNIPKEVSGYLRGFELVFMQLTQILENRGVKEIECEVGDEFNYNIHNAIESIEAEKEEDVNKISKILQKGFMINEKVLRQVVVEVFIKKNEEENQDLEEVINENKEGEDVNG